MDGAEWLRTELTSFGCASCGHAYQPGRIRILAQRDELFFVDLGCATCGTQAIAVVTIQAEPDGSHAEAGEIGPIQLSLAAPAAPAALSADEILDMHDFLAGFDGDFAGLFERESGTA